MILENYIPKHKTSYRRKLKFIATLVFACVAISIYSMQQFDVPLPKWVNNYVNDFICLPLVLSIGQFVVRRIKRYPYLIVPLHVILMTALYFSIYFEWFLPEYNPRYTGDIVDVVLYFMGAMYFFISEKYWKGF